MYEYAKVKAYLSEHPQTTDAEAETEALGYNHAQIGGFLAEQWKLPHTLRHAIANHHTPLEAEEDDSLMAFYIAVGNHISKLTFNDREDDDPE